MTMGMIFEQVPEQARQLPAEDQLRLAEQLKAILQADAKSKSNWHTFLRETVD
jgi:hypothetical protein